MSYLKYFLFCLFITTSLFTDVDFGYPDTTTGSVIPNLTDVGGDGYDPQIATDSIGKYVYAVWRRSGLIQLARSENYGVTWVDPASTGGGGFTSPDLSDGTDSSSDPQITTDLTGQYVYVTWKIKKASRNYRIQVARSDDWGNTWDVPDYLTIDDVEGSNNANASQIATDSSGNVYVIWYKSDGTNDIIQVARSENFGVTWADPTSTGGGGFTSPNLSENGGTASSPQIATDSSGNVYATWQRFDGYNNVIQATTSIDHGDNWGVPLKLSEDEGTTTGRNAYGPQIAIGSNGDYVYVTWRKGNGTYDVVQVTRSTTNGTSWEVSTDLSDDTKSAMESKIAAALNGDYVHVIWRISDGTNQIIQVKRSTDNGMTWLDPVQTLSTAGENAYEPQIATDSSGALVYATWSRNYVAQISLSLDNGVTWGDPETTPGSVTSNLSIDGVEATKPQIAIDSAGDNIYVTWEMWDDALGAYIIQVVRGEGTFESLNVLYNTYMTNLLLQKDYVNELYWNSLTKATKYRVCLNLQSNLVYEGTNLQYFQHGITTPSIYYISWIDDNGEESIPKIVQIP